MIALRTLVLLTVVVAASMALSACGKKGSPEFPPGSSYPIQYPPAAEERQTPEPQQKAEPGIEPKGAAVSPLGFPLEYPNRPSY